MCNTGMCICIKRTLCQRRKFVYCITLCIPLSDLPNVLGTVVGTELLVMIIIPPLFKTVKGTKVDTLFAPYL